MAPFTWANVLEATNSKAVPEELFSHVEQSLNNGLKQGMYLEVCYKNGPDVYWIAQITMVCGQFLRTQFIGSDEEEWINIDTTKVYPLGWCGAHEEFVDPPEHIKKIHGSKIIDIMMAALATYASVTIEALKNKGLSPIDRIKQGMKVEVQNTIDPYKYWIATIRENKGGRLLLKYDGSDEDLPEFWMFYTSQRLCSYGYVTNKGSPWQFKYPAKINKFSCKNKLSALLRQCSEENIKDPTPDDLFQGNTNLESHNFVSGMKLEALDPQTMQTIRPATVAKVYNNFHFLVVIDDHTDDYEDTKMCLICDSKNPYIYPIGWAEKHSVPFTIPKIWKEDIFVWDEYLTMTSSVPAPEYCFGKKTRTKIEVNMKLEAVNPKKPEEIHVANVCNITGHMMCVELIPIGEKFWFAQDCDLTFPVGWCDSNIYKMTVPTFKIEPVKVVKEVRKPAEQWCDRIYFNYKCYSGPMISRNKLSQLPKHVGPGPLSLVLKEVMNKIISASYKPAKLLKDWEVEEGPAEEGMRLEMLKAKLKSSTYHAYVPIATSTEQVVSFCREYCVKLQACPHLFGPKEYTEQCPATCQMVDKSRFQNTSDKRRTKASNIGRRKKRKGAPAGKPKPTSQDTNKDVLESPESEHSAGSAPPSESGTRPNSPDNTNNKRKAKPGPKIERSKIKTRGAKLPNFAIQIKEAHWNKKDVETIYNNSCVKKPSSNESDTENDSRSSNSRDLKHISDVSDSEEPELKKLKFTTDDPLPTDNKTFEKNAIMAHIKNKLKLSLNPVTWSINDVYKYLTNTEDCKLVADRLKEEQIDGQAFIMLDLSVLREFLHMKREFALQLCRHIAIIKWYYIMSYGAEA